MINADKIRSMTYDELREFICNNIKSNPFGYCAYGGINLEELRAVVSEELRDTVSQEEDGEQNATD